MLRYLITYPLFWGKTGPKKEVKPPTQLIFLSSIILSLIEIII